AGVRKSLSKLTMKDSPVRLERGRDLEIATTLFIVTLLDQAKATTQPGNAERAIDLHCLFKRVLCLCDPVIRTTQEPSQSVGRRVTRGESHYMGDSSICFRDAIEAEL